MRISEIIRESEEPGQNGKLKEVDILKDIESAIEFAYKEVKANPELLTDPATQDDQKQPQEVEEGIKGTLGKAALAGMIALSGLSAQANQELTNNLAYCAGIMTHVGTIMMSTTSAQKGQELYNKGLEAMQLATARDPYSMKIFSDTQNRMARASADSYKQALQGLSGCHNIINKAIQQNFEQEKKRQEYFATPAGKAELASRVETRNQEAKKRFDRELETKFNEEISQISIYIRDNKDNRYESNDYKNINYRGGDLKGSSYTGQVNTENMPDGYGVMKLVGQDGIPVGILSGNWEDGKLINKRRPGQAAWMAHSTFISIQSGDNSDIGARSVKHKGSINEIYKFIPDFAKSLVAGKSEQSQSQVQPDKPKYDPNEVRTENYKSGASFTGKFNSDGKRVEGTYKYANGDIITGAWKDGKPFNAEFTSSTGKKGNYVDGVWQSQSQSSNSPKTVTNLDTGNGSSYTGQINQKGEMNGPGVLTVSNGTKVEAIFKDGNLNGKGTMILPNGDKVFANFVNSILQGPAEMHKPNGEKFSFTYDNNNIVDGTVKKIN